MAGPLRIVQKWCVRQNTCYTRCARLEVAHRVINGLGQVLSACACSHHTQPVYIFALFELRANIHAPRSMYDLRGIASMRSLLQKALIWTDCRGN